MYDSWTASLRRALRGQRTLVTWPEAPGNNGIYSHTYSFFCSKHYGKGFSFKRFLLDRNADFEFYRHSTKLGICKLSKLSKRKKKAKVELSWLLSLPVRNSTTSKFQNQQFALSSVAQEILCSLTN